MDNTLRNNEKHWRVAYTSPRAEKAVASLLEQKGTEYYLPLRRTLKQWSDRKKWVDEVLFPSYIFVKVDMKEYYDVINLHGMVSYVRFGGQAACIRESTLQNIKLLAEQGALVELSDSMPQPGESYTISSGPLRGISGRVVRHKGKKHFVLEVEELGKYLVLPFTALTADPNAGRKEEM